MTIDWTVSVGALVIAVTNVCTLLVVAWRLSLRFTIMERKVNLMFAWFLRQIAGKPEILNEAEMRDFFGLRKAD